MPAKRLQGYVPGQPLHHAIPEQGRWLKAVVTGFFAYHAVPTHARALGASRHHVTDLGDVRCGGAVKRIT